jgi:hypothetical protein
MAVIRKRISKLAQIGSGLVAGIFDRASNVEWGTYFLEIDAPADCSLH